jgi:hypothetical protein
VHLRVNAKDRSDPRQVRADLMSDPRSPYTAADWDQLRAMTADALRAEVDKYLRTSAHGACACGGHPHANARSGEVVLLGTDDPAFLAMTTQAERDRAERTLRGEAVNAMVAARDRGQSLSADDPALRAMTSVTRTAILAEHRDRANAGTPSAGGSGNEAFEAMDPEATRREVLAHHGLRRKGGR